MTRFGGHGAEEGSADGEHAAEGGQEHQAGDEGLLELDQHLETSRQENI